jgi:hypothetical protein
MDGAEAEAALRRALAAQARPDVARVHPSWWIRALRDESPSVQRVVAAHCDPSLRPLLQRALHLEPADLRPRRRPDPDALRWALGLWDERIVGDFPEWPEDPPVILALGRLNLWEIVALARGSGLAKRALAAVDPPPLPVRGRSRFDHFQGVWAARNRSSLADARRLFQADLKSWRRKRGWGSLGLITFGRLLAHAEEYRGRWALQHLPYAAGRRIRPAIKDRGERMTFWEGEILKAAWARLVAEGQIRSLGGLTREHQYL